MATPEVDPGSTRARIVRLLVLAGAIAAGILLQGLLRARLDAIQELSTRDMLAARAELAVVLRVVGTAVFGVTTALGIAIALSSRKAQRRLGLPVGISVAALSIAGLALCWYAAAVLAACRA